MAKRKLSSKRNWLIGSATLVVVLGAVLAFDISQSPRLPMASSSLSNIAAREGSRPDTTDAPPGTNIAHQQRTQNAPLSLQQVLLARAASLAGVQVSHSLASVHGAQELFLSPSAARGPQQAFMAPSEFAHLHPGYDGSLHVRLPRHLVEEVTQLGWGEPHPRSKDTAMLYGPRNEGELETIWKLLSISHQYASGNL